MVNEFYITAGLLPDDGSSVKGFFITAGLVPEDAESQNFPLPALLNAAQPTRIIQ